MEMVSLPPHLDRRGPGIAPEARALDLEAKMGSDEALSWRS